MSDTIHIHIERECPVRVITVEPTGARGAAGTSATVAVGTTTTGAAGSSASVTNSGTTSAAVFNFTIPRGDTGATGAAGPNSVTSATTSDGTANLSVATISGGGSGLTGLVSSQITDATSDGNANKEKVLKTDDQGSLTVTNSFGVNASFGSSLTVGDGDSVNGRYDIFANTNHFQWYSDSALYGEREFVITTENLTSSGSWAYKYPAASGTFAVTASTTGVPDKLTDGTIAGTLAINSISYTYGTGAAAAHRTALGLTTLATTTPAANVATFLATPTSANLAAAVTDETGSGSLVFGTSPTLTTPTIAAINGGTAANDDITIQGTTNATRTTSYVNLQPNGGNVGIGTATPTTPLYIYTAGNNSVTIEAGTGDSQVAFRSGGSPRFLFGYEDADDGFRIYNYGTTSTALFVKSNTGNVGIGTTSPNAAALLDLTTTSKGFLPPRMTTTQRNAITSVPAGLMIYNTSLNKLNVYNGTTWETVTSL